MKALSLWQPWASLVANGSKHVETRSWQTSFAGDVAIHATSYMPAEGRELLALEPFRSALAQELADDTEVSLPRGALLAVVRLARCTSISEGDGTMLMRTNPREYAFGNYAPGRFAWVLEDVRRLPSPLPCRGRQGLWELPVDVEKEVLCHV